MNIKERIEKRAANLIIDEIKQKGFCSVVDPESSIKKVKKHTGIDLVNCYFMLKFK